MISRRLAGTRRLLALAFVLPLGCTGPRDVGSTITVAAASSLTDVMEDIAALWNEGADLELRCTFAATSTLARQIESGAPFHMLLSANRDWMEHLAGLGHLDESDTFLFARNDLVAVGPNAPGRTSIEADPAAYLGSGRWAMGDPEHVPVGSYAKRALERLGLWASVEPRVLPAPSARAALRLVESGEADGGIVYRTDALKSDAVRVIDAFADGLGAEVEVMGGVLDASEAGPLAEWLQGPEVRQILLDHGFEAP